MRLVYVLVTAWIVAYMLAWGRDGFRFVGRERDQVLRAHIKDAPVKQHLVSP